VINRIYPRMKYADYQSLKNDAIFTTKTANVCEICFLNITKYCDFSKSNTENLLRVLRPNEINIQSKFMKTSKSDKTNENSENIFSSHYNRNDNLQTVNYRQIFVGDAQIGLKKNNLAHNRQISSKTLHPIINNKKFLSEEKKVLDYRQKDLDKTDLDSRRSSSLHTAIKLKK